LGAVREGVAVSRVENAADICAAEPLTVTFDESARRTTSP
jgi:hypothetical protein